MLHKWSTLRPLIKALIILCSALVLTTVATDVYVVGRVSSASLWASLWVTIPVSSCGLFWGYLIGVGELDSLDSTFEHWTFSVLFALVLPLAVLMLLGSSGDDPSGLGYVGRETSLQLIAQAVNYIACMTAMTLALSIFFPIAQLLRTSDPAS